MKLYYSKGACSLVVRIIINELELSCDFIAVNLKDKTTEYGDDFFKVNPKGAVPTIETDNKEIITENAVILQYLADVNHDNELLPPVRELSRYRVLEWLNYITTELHKGFGPIFNTTVPDQMKQDIFVPILIKKFTFLDKNLQKKKFLMGDIFILPDAYLFVMLNWAYGRKFDLSSCVELKRFFEEMQQRESVKQSILQEELQVATP